MSNEIEKEQRQQIKLLNAALNRADAKNRRLISDHRLLVSFAQFSVVIFTIQIIALCVWGLA